MIEFKPFEVECLNGVAIDDEKKRTLAWQQAFDALQDPVSIHDLDNRVLYVNAAFSKAFKCSQRDAIGLLCHEVVHGADCPCHACPHERAVLTEKMASEEFYHSRLEQYLEVTIYPIQDNLGQVTGTIHYINNITGVRQMQVGFELFKSLMAQSAEATYVVDSNSRQILDINEQACRDTQYCQEVLRGKSLFDLEPSLQMHSTRHEYVEKLRLTGHARWQGRHRRKDGSFFPVEVHARQMIIGDATYLLFRVRDVSDRMHAEALIKEGQ